jgi:hypothetical protein
MPTSDPREAIEAFHAWRSALLLPGHQVASGDEVPDPELVLASKLLKVFAALYPEFRAPLVPLQRTFLDNDYTARVDPQRWRDALARADLS